MIYVAFDHTGEVVAHTAGRKTCTDLHNWEHLGPGGFVTSAGDCESYFAAMHLAERLSEYTGLDFFATDRGPHVHPRYDIVERPAVGHQVSKAFNGDYYPCGEIVKVSESGDRVTTSTGEVFTRRKTHSSVPVKRSAVWKVKGSDTFSMVRGYINQRNPQF